MAIRQKLKLGDVLVKAGESRRNPFGGLQKMPPIQRKKFSFYPVMWFSCILMEWWSR